MQCVCKWFHIILAITVFTTTYRTYYVQYFKILHPFYRSNATDLLSTDKYIHSSFISFVLPLFYFTYDLWCNLLWSWQVSCIHGWCLWSCRKTIGDHAEAKWKCSCYIGVLVGFLLGKGVINPIREVRN